MLITVITLLASIGLTTYLRLKSYTLDAIPLAIAMGTGSSLILFLTAYFNTYILGPLERLEQKLIPNLVHLYREDKILALGRLLLFLFPILSLMCITLLLIPTIDQKNLLFVIWMIVFGAAIDLLRYSWHRSTSYLTPLFLVKAMEKDAQRAAKEGNDEALWGCIDGVSEVCIKAIDRNKLALSCQAIQTLPPIMKTYYEASKSIARPTLNSSVKEQPGTDEISYTMFYLLQHLELINDRALKRRLEIICRQLVVILGKIIVYSAKFDLSLTSFPTHFLTKFGLKAQQHHFEEVGLLTTSTLVEISKTIINEIDVTYLELQDTFLSIITGLDALAKGTFKKYKDTHIASLIEPLQQVQKLFQSEKMAKHADTPVILGEINKVLQEWDTLEKMMKSLPVIPELSEDTSLPPMPPPG